MRLIMMILMMFITIPTLSAADNRISSELQQMPSLMNTDGDKTDQAAPKKQGYTTFEMISPRDQETIQNQPTVTVTFKVIPELATEDSIQLLLDGMPWQSPTHQTQITWTNPERGMHQLSGLLLDRHNGILRMTGPVTVYIHRASAAGR